MIRERLSEYKNFPGIFREVFFIFYCRLTEFSRNKTLWDFPTTKLPFAEFPLTFFPFSFCGGVCPSAAGFPILSFRGFPVFLYGIFPVLPLRFFPSSSPRGFSILPRGVFLFFPAEFPSDMRQRKLPELSGSFFSGDDAFIF